MKQERVDKVNHYLDIVETVVQRSTCRRKIYGAVTIQHDEIVSIGYMGAPQGRTNCLDLEYCVRKKLRVLRGERYKLCHSAHAEADAIISAQRSEMLGADMLLVGCEAVSGELIQSSNSCSMCEQATVNTGISGVYIRDMPSQYRMINVHNDWVLRGGPLDGVLGYQH